MHFMYTILRYVIYFTCVSLETITNVFDPIHRNIQQTGGVVTVVPLSCARGEQTTIQGVSNAFIVWCALTYATLDAASVAEKDQWVSATRSAIQHYQGEGMK